MTRRPITAAESAAWRDLYAQGWTARQIGRRAGRDHKSVTAHLRRHGVDIETTRAPQGRTQVDIRRDIAAAEARIARAAAELEGAIAERERLRLMMAGVAA